MISSMTPPVALVPELTSLPWLNSVSDQLGDPTTHCEELVGVDIGHVDVPGLTASEVCAGFVMRNCDLQAATMLFTQREEGSFSGIQKTVGANIVPSRMTHWALGSKRPQINTLIFRTFTLAYSFDFGLPAAEIPTSFRTRLVLHDARRKRAKIGVGRRHVAWTVPEPQTGAQQGKLSPPMQQRAVPCTNRSTEQRLAIFEVTSLRSGRPSAGRIGRLSHLFARYSSP